jgi:hypothetical protein
MNDLKTPRGWHRDEAGVTHEMEGKVDPITGAVSFPYPPNAAIYTYDPAYVPDVLPRPTYAPDVDLPVTDAPKTFQDLLDDYGAIRYQQGRTGDYLTEKENQAEQALIAHMEALRQEIARLRAGLNDVADALKELDS